MLNCWRYQGYTTPFLNCPLMSPYNPHLNPFRTYHSQNTYLDRDSLTDPTFFWDNLSTAPKHQTHMFSLYLDETCSWLNFLPRFLSSDHRSLCTTDVNLHISCIRVYVVLLTYLLACQTCDIDFVEELICFTDATVVPPFQVQTQQLKHLRKIIFFRVNTDFFMKRLQFNTQIITCMKIQKRQSVEREYPSCRSIYKTPL